MIRYALVCDKRHEFESWFSNSAAFDKQVVQGLVTCPLCASANVEKALMTPRLSRSDSPSRRPADGESREEHQRTQEAQAQETRTQEARTAQAGAPAPQSEAAAAAAPEAASAPAAAEPVAMMSPREQELRKKLRELRDHIVQNAENVGARFPEEARKMHYGEAEHRSIYGVASTEDAKAMHEEGIAFSALPVLPEDRN